ncbi:hypothetical protein DDE19_10345 [Micromonospora ureilytica]|uniref:Swt1-like HEPN domain-containing protein n=1 Tax=Micromonospora ureilytica TaxID=709868 RepID=A0A3N9XXI6_9ACTN|nr:hypothetical protein [Micromonospora ureilytica]RQX17755.1 hypothetical protein DDE19_10345 [Micromonospora ureilytica]
MTAGWYSDVAERIASANYTFFHAGALRRSANFIDDLLQDLRDRGFHVLLVDCVDVLQTGWGSALPAGQSGNLYVIWRPEILLTRSDFEDLIRQARPPVHSALMEGNRVVIVSTMPQMMFPVPVGSSVIADAAKVHPSPLPATLLRRVVPSLPSDTAERIVLRAQGCVALAEGYALVDRSAASGNQKSREAERLLLETLREAFAELGPEILALLEHLVLECGVVDVSQMDLRDHWIAALEDAGLATIDDSTEMVRLFHPSWQDTARLALSQALRAVLQPPNAWRAIAVSLFELERTVRSLVSQGLEARYGEGWRQGGLDTLAPKVVALARAETQGEFVSVADLHSPLDWLLLDQLFALAAETAQHVRLGGISSREWRQFSERIVPVRNRMSHMRLPRPGDLDEVRRTLRILNARIRSTPLPSAGRQTTPAERDLDGVSAGLLATQQPGAV